MSRFFKFEETTSDIPFYNGEPKLSKLDWMLLVMAEILFLIPIIFPIEMGDEVFSCYLCLVVLLPILYVSKGKWNLFFKKIKRSDIKLIIACTILPFVYSMAVIAVLEYLKISSNNPLANETHASLSVVILMAIQLLGEEFFKIILLILIMFLIYRFTENRKLSIVIAAIFTMMAFGSVHQSYGPLIQVLLVQGLGSIFDLYAYIKTKNVLVSYLAHILFDFIPFAMEIAFFLLTGQPLL